MLSITLDIFPKNILIFYLSILSIMRIQDRLVVFKPLKPTKMTIRMPPLRSRRREGSLGVERGGIIKMKGRMC